MNYNRFLDKTIEIAYNSQGVGKNNNVRIGAILINKKHVISFGTNSYDTHTVMTRFHRFPFTHAEARAVIRVGVYPWSCKELTIFIARIKKDNSLGMSRPCSGCMQLLRYVCVKRIIYTTGFGREIEVVKLL